MDHSNETLYKNTLYLTSGIFVFLMCVATSSPALVQRDSSAAVPTAHGAEIPTLGRFIVTPSAARFVAPASVGLDEQGAEVARQGSL